MCAAKGQAERPHRGEQDAQLDAARAEGHHAAQERRGQRARDRGLVRDVARDGVGVDGVLGARRAEACLRAEHDERRVEAAEEEEEQQEGGEGDGGGGLVGPEHEVEQQEEQQEGAGEEAAPAWGHDA